MAVRPGRPGSGSGVDFILTQLLAQRAAVDAQDFRGPRLVAAGEIQECPEQRLLDFSQHELVEIRRVMTIQVGEVASQGLFGVIPQTMGGGCELRVVSQLMRLPRFVRHFQTLYCRSAIHAASSSILLLCANRLRTSRCCSRADSTRTTRSRSAAVSGRVLRYQLRCLRAMRTPVNSP